MKRSSAMAALMMAAALPCSAGAQTLTNLKNQPPDGAVFTMLMTDGTVIAQGGGDTDFWKLTPDNTGSYVNGTWKQIASLPSGYSPYANAEAVLADGRLVISGGEYNFGQFAFTHKSAIYDPLANTWTMIKPPEGWSNIGDAPAIVLPDGRFVIGYKFRTKMAALDPKTLKWSPLTSTGKNGHMIAEEGWVLLPDGNFLTVDVKAHPKSEIYDSKTGHWINLGDTANVDLRGPQNCCGNCIPYGRHNQKCYDPPGETGAAVRRPDGTIFATGSIPDGQSIAHTAIFTPSGKRGTWTAGPDFPNGDQSYDSPVSILPNGNVLVEGANSGALYEFDGTKLNKTSYFGYGSLMPLPSGEVLVGGYAVYKSTGSYQQSWAPTITNVSSTLTRGQSYKISGTQFNGLNQGAAFGDEFDTHTNYPLVRITITSTGHVFYCRTHDHSTMGVATGNKTVSTHFDVPSGMETGAGELEVVANGIPSTAVAVTVQ